MSYLRILKRCGDMAWRTGQYFKKAIDIFCSMMYICQVAKSSVALYGVWRSPVAHVLWEHGAGGSNPLTPTRCGPVVKRLRHRPFTAVTGVRFSSGSPFLLGIDWAFSSVGQSSRLITDRSGVQVPEGPPRGPVVQLVSTPACHAGGQGFEPPPGRHFLREIDSPACWCSSMAEQLICNQ